MTATMTPTPNPTMSDQNTVPVRRRWIQLELAFDAPSADAAGPAVAQTTPSPRGA